EPFRSWKNRTWFWAGLFNLTPNFFSSNATMGYSGATIDAVFGAMAESKQVHKLPVYWLLLLLAVYLLVIGPFDHWILKRLKKQMWTWITFPGYVLFFSGLIYYIGFLLRAGD